MKQLLTPEKIFYLLFLLPFLTPIYTFSSQFKYPSTKKNRDPLFPLINKKGEILIKEGKQIKDLSLQGVIYSKNSRAVVINGKIVKEGEVVEGFKIKKIESKRVFLEKDKEVFILKWEEQ